MDDYEQISSLVPGDDTGSLDSHNDSGYGARMCLSPDPGLGSDSEPQRAPYYSQVTQCNPYIHTNPVVISPSSLV